MYPDKVGSDPEDSHSVYKEKEDNKVYPKAIGL